MELVMVLSTLQSQLLKKIDSRLSAHGISFTELIVMYHLQTAPSKTMRRIDLAESVGLSASGITRLLAPMEKNRLVRKELNPRDARVSLVKLSKTGERILEESFVSFEDSADTLLQALDPVQLGKFLELAKAVL